MVRLSDRLGGRDNNFNLIRMVAAIGVLISHAFPISLGTGAAEPLEEAVGLSLGGVSVLVFFGISGFLISRSYDRSEDVLDWLTARVLRLFPALIVVLALTVAVLGPLVTTLDLGDYLLHPETWTYMVRNASLVSLQYELPGVFAGLPYPGAINGSLWTLFYEVACYVGAFALGALGALKPGPRAAGLFAAYAIAWAAAAWAQALGLLHVRLEAFAGLSLPFVIGAAFYVWRDRIPLSFGLAIALAGLAALLREFALFRPVFALALIYGVFVLAYLPGGRIRRYNDIGDFSYGVYIYAFPMQQLAVLAFGAATPWLNIATALPLTLVFAAISWTLVERPSLDARRAVVRRLRGAFARRRFRRSSRGA